MILECILYSTCSAQLPMLGTTMDSADRFVRRAGIATDSECGIGGSFLEIVYAPVDFQSIPGILVLSFDSTLCVNSIEWMRANPESESSLSYILSHRPTCSFASASARIRNDCTLAQYNQALSKLEQELGPASHPYQDYVREVAQKRAELTPVQFEQWAREFYPNPALTPKPEDDLTDANWEKRPYIRGLRFHQGKLRYSEHFMPKDYPDR